MLETALRVGVWLVILIAALSFVDLIFRRIL